MTTTEIILRVLEFVLLPVTGWLSNSASTSRLLAKVKRGSPASLLIHRIHGIAQLLDKEEQKDENE